MFEGKEALRIAQNTEEFISELDDSVADLRRRYKALADLQKMAAGERECLSQAAEEVDDNCRRSFSNARSDIVELAARVDDVADELAARVDDVAETVTALIAHVNSEFKKVEVAVNKIHKTVEDNLPYEKMVAIDGGDCVPVPAEVVIQAILDYLKLDLSIQPGKPATEGRLVAKKRRAKKE